MPKSRTPREASFYQEQILEILSECTHGGVLSLEEFDCKISGLFAAAKVDGFNLKEFTGWVEKEKDASYNKGKQVA